LAFILRLRRRRLPLRAASFARRLAQPLRAARARFELRRRPFLAFLLLAIGTTTFLETLRRRMRLTRGFEAVFALAAKVRRALRAAARRFMRLSAAPRTPNFFTARFQAIAPRETVRRATLRLLTFRRTIRRPLPRGGLNTKPIISYLRSGQKKRRGGKTALLRVLPPLLLAAQLYRVNCTPGW
jgi:hypothetical protein